MTPAEFVVELTESYRAGFRRYRLASVTTFFGVFFLTLLVGAAFSVTRGINITYAYAEKNLARISPGMTSLPYDGYDVNRRIILNDNDVRMLEKSFPGQVRDVCPVVTGVASTGIGNKNFPSRVYGIKTDCLDAMFLSLCFGRDISVNDVTERKKICLISKAAAECYFDESRPESALSGFIDIDGIRFRVVGIFKGIRNTIDSDFIIVPESTAVSLWNVTENYNTIILNLKGFQTENENMDFSASVRRLIALEHSFDPDDESALSISDNFSAYSQVKSLLGGFRLIILIFCLLILVFVIFGVSNILFISIRERTYEIVMRRILGASDAHIFTLVVCESVLIMFFSTLLGVLAADGALFAMDRIVAPTRTEDYYIWGSFKIDFSIVITILSSLLVSGIIAGLAPAKRAVGLKVTQVH